MTVSVPRTLRTLGEHRTWQGSPVFRSSDDTWTCVGETPEERIRGVHVGPDAMDGHGPDAIGSGFIRALQRIQGDAVFAAGELITAICQGFLSALEAWIPAQMVMQVLGTGPVPTFAPRHVPAGRAMGGHVLPSSGILST